MNMKRFMKRLLLLPLMFLPNVAFANPACAVCTVAVVASFGIARKLGLPDTIVGVWAGALLTLIGYWTILIFDKKNWHFAGRDFLIMLTSIAMIGGVYIKDVTYSPIIIWHAFYLDPILFSSLLGMALFIYSQTLYQWMKAKNGGHAHFPFEKVALPVLFLVLASVYFSYFPLKSHSLVSEAFK